MTDLSPLPADSVNTDKVHVAVVVEQTSEEFNNDFAEEAHNPRTVVQKSTRSSKRAHSNASISERQKFRSKLDSFAMYSDDLSAFDDAEDESSLDANLAPLAPNYTRSIPFNLRHHSNGSVGAEMTSSAGEMRQSPLDYLWSNANMDSLFPIKLINQEQMKSIMNLHYSQPLPSCDDVFPWLHGIHQSNSNQRDFLNSISNFTSINRNNFGAFQNQSSKIPSTYRGLIPVQSEPIKSSPVASSGTLKGSISHVEILETLAISKESLFDFLRQFLKDLNFDRKSEQYDTILRTLFDDCVLLRVIPVFRNLDPEKGISLRNFHIQVSKTAQISDFIVYCFNEGHLSESHQDTCRCKPVARLLYFAQLKHAVENPELVDLLCSTLLLQKNDVEFYRDPENSRLLAHDVLKDSDSILTEGNICTVADLKYFSNWENNYLLREKFEISKMSSATETFPNVWAGNSTNFETLKTKGFRPKVNNPSTSSNGEKVPLYVDSKNSTLLASQDDLISEGEDLLINPAGADWKMYVFCSEGFVFPSLDRLKELLAEDYVNDKGIYLDFPPSGSIGMGDCTDTDLVSIINTCKLLYARSSASEPSLIYCSDGYTESSLLLVLFMIYATGKKLTEVVVDLHMVHGRPFFLFPTDVQLISKIEDILIHYSPQNNNYANPNELEVLSDAVIYKYLFSSKERSWFLKLNGSLPSKILPHLYLGSLNHANEFELLKELNIKRIVSVGENLSWLESEEYSDSLTRRVINSNITILSNFQPGCPVVELMVVNNVQDDGIDMLTHNLQDILDFIDEGYEKDQPVLVHCRVGVSRSATVCIAEVMKRLKISLIKAYIFVRVRRLNIIIQPNLRFMYELVKWEESERLKLKQRKSKASNSKSMKLEQLGSPMKISFNDSDDSDDDDTNAGSRRNDNFDDSGDTCKNLGKENLRLSESVNSLLSDFSDFTEVSVANLLDFRDHENVISLRRVKTSSSPINEKNEITSRKYVDGGDDDREKEEGKGEEEIWLRDVDWHILCREIDNLNKVYIRV